MRRTVVTAVVACLLGAATVGAVGSAATKKSSKPRQAQTTQTSTTPSGPPPTMKDMLAKRQAAQDAYLTKVAGDLNVSLSDLKSALAGVRDDQLAAAVSANRLTQAEADAIKACAAAPLTCDRSNLPAFGRGFGGDFDGPGMGFGGGPGHNDTFYAAVAKKLGKTTDEVQKAFESNRPTPPRDHWGGPGGPGGHHGFGHGGPGGPPPGMPGGQQGGSYPGY